MNILVCAGLDPSGGAGLLADARVIADLGGRALGVVTTLTIQSTSGMTASHVVDPAIVAAQIRALVDDMPIAAVKIGMLGSVEMAHAIASALSTPTLSSMPTVWDPVIGPSLRSFGSVGSVGSVAPIDLRAAWSALRSIVTLVTPNVAEMAALGPIDVPVLAKGGHAGGDTSDDVIEGVILSAPRIPGGEHVHGTGCALSSAIAVHLARGLDVVEACRAAKIYVRERIESSIAAGRGARSIV